MTDMVKSVQDLPEWFRIEQYQVFENLSDQELIEQLEMRVLTLNDTDHISLDGEFYYAGIKEHPLLDQEACHKSIVEFCEAEGDTIKEPDWLDSRKSENKSNGLILPRTESVIPLDLQYAHYLGMCAKQYLEVTEDKVAEEQVFPNTSFADMDISISAIMPGEEVGLFIDLNQSDDVILSDLKHLLPGFRKLLNRAEPAKGKYTPSVKDRILEHKVMAFIDLKIWEKEESKDITYGVMSRALFPESSQDGSKGEEYIRLTVKKWFDRVMEDGFFESWRSKLRQV